uniref:Ciliary microtubule inner protein 3 n=1 Tax=Mus spicilegus TaxID=10103 RepID=A0A8C6N602_MUSSI
MAKIKDSQKSLVPSRGQKMTSGTKAKVPLTALSQKWKRDREQTLEAAYVPVVVDPRGQNPDTSISKPDLVAHLGLRHLEVPILHLHPMVLGPRGKNHSCLEKQCIPGLASDYGISHHEISYATE